MSTQISSGRDSPDPLAAWGSPPPNETEQERRDRIKQEAQTRRRNEEIDAAIRAEARVGRTARVARVLLLGQSESGKSTLLRHFQRLYNPDEFRQERIFWRAVIQLNVVRSILLVLDTISPTSPSPSSPIPPLHGSPSDNLQDSSHGSERIYVPQIASSASSASGDHSRESPLPQWEEASLYLTAIEFASEPNDSLADSEVTFTAPARLESLRNELLPPLQRIEQILISKLIPSPNSTEATQLAGPSNSRFPVSQHSIRPPGSASLCRNPELVVRPGVRKLFRRELDENSSATDQRTPPNVSSFKSDPLDLRDEPLEVLYSLRRQIIALWSDKSVQEILWKKGIMLEQEPGFFLNDLERITALSFVPSDDDVLKARLKTIGASEHKFEINQSDRKQFCELRLVDIGGSRSQEDSFQLWLSICSLKILAKVDLLLFLNKCDLLNRKLKKGIRFSKYVISYGDRENNTMGVVKYLKKGFANIVKVHSPRERRVYMHPMTAIDATATSATLYLAEDIIIRKHLDQSTIV